MERPPFQNEYPADFSNPAVRAQFQKALVGTKAALSTLKTQATFRNQDDARQAVDEAKAAFGLWSRTSVEERAAILFRLANLMRHRRFELDALILLEVHKNWSEADADVCEAIDFLKYYGREALQIPQAQPLGVVAVIAPWNFPLAILTGMTAAALVMGNTVVMKPAEQSSGIARRLFELFAEAGLPKNVLQWMPGVGETVGDALVRHPDVAMVCFTGSKEVGMHIASLKKRVICEMGGKNAIIVDETADIEAAVEQSKLSAFGFQGQKCSACSRVILLPKVYEPFRERFVESVSKIRIGNPEDFENFMGPVIDEEAFLKISRLIENRGGVPKGGNFIPPTIFDDVSPSASIAQQEIFGPVVCLIKAANLDDALKIAHQVPYDLTGGLFSKDPSSIERIKRDYEVGNLYINRKITGALVACQPFGGYRLSSLGFKAGGPEYLWQFSNISRPPEMPALRNLPTASFQPEDRNTLIAIKEGPRWLTKTVCERLTSS